MNLTRLIRIKEKIASSDEFSPQDRDFILEAINTSVILQNAAAVHLNMLSGGIAKPSFANIKHLYPDEFPDPSHCTCCDLDIELHEDEQGFHHVVKGKRIACSGGKP